MQSKDKLAAALPHIEAYRSGLAAVLARLDAPTLAAVEALGRSLDAALASVVAPGRGAGGGRKAATKLTLSSRLGVRHYVGWQAVADALGVSAAGLAVRFSNTKGDVMVLRRTDTEGAECDVALQRGHVGAPGGLDPVVGEGRTGRPIGPATPDELGTEAPSAREQKLAVRRGRRQAKKLAPVAEITDAMRDTMRRESNKLKALD